jgi:hypothetical protein
VRCSFASESALFVPDSVERSAESCFAENKTILELIFQAKSPLARIDNAFLHHSKCLPGAVFLAANVWQMWHLKHGANSRAVMILCLPIALHFRQAAFLLRSEC